MSDEAQPYRTVEIVQTEHLSDIGTPGADPASEQSAIVESKSAGVSPRSGYPPPAEYRFKPGGPGGPGRKPKDKRIVEAEELLKSALPEATRRIIEIARGPEDDIALRASLAIQDRTMGKAVTVTELEAGGESKVLLTMSIERARELMEGDGDEDSDSSDY